MNRIMRYMRYLLTFALLLVASLAFSKPDRPIEKKLPPIPPVSTLAGKTNWGNLTIADGEVVLSQHPHWTAIGTVLPNGRIKLTWATTQGGREAHGLYSWDGKEMRGAWGWTDGCTYNDAGDLIGNIHGDRIYRVEPEPDF